MEKTKIVATIGPTSIKPAVLKEMIKQGMDVCRLNFSHGDHAWHKMAIKRIRVAEKQMKRKVGIMADIQGPRIRVASHKNVVLKKGERVFLTDNRTPHNHHHKKDLLLDWIGFYEHLKPKDIVYIEDGMIQLEVTRRQRFGCEAKTVVAGTVKPHKGVNIPAISHYMGFLTDKDLADLEFIMSQDVDFIAASFVADEKDLANLKMIMSYLKAKTDSALGREDDGLTELPWIVSKVERRKAMKNLEGIVKNSDAVLVARGDLAIEMPQEKVGIFQKDIVHFCLKHKKPVIVATQMMVSMIKHVRPTRAEISDVTNAVIDNADAVMMSNETAMGEHPIEVIKTTARIISSAEESSYNDVKLKKQGRFARMLTPGKEGVARRKTIKPKKLETALEYSSLRQENVRVILDSRKAEEKRKATLMWGVR